MGEMRGREEERWTAYDLCTILHFATQPELKNFSYWEIIQRLALIYLSLPKLCQLLLLPLLLLPVHIFPHPTT